MRIQLKLFVLLLVIAIVPLAALSWRGERATQDLGQALANFGRAAVTQEIETQLSQAVGYSADLLAAQQRQVEMALRLQAGEVERRLAGPAPIDAAPVYPSSDFDDSSRWPPGAELALDHAIASPGRELQAVPISREQSVVLRCRPISMPRDGASVHGASGLHGQGLPRPRRGQSRRCSIGST